MKQRLTTLLVLGLLLAAARFGYRHRQRALLFLAKFFARNPPPPSLPTTSSWTEGFPVLSNEISTTGEFITSLFALFAEAKAKSKYGLGVIQGYGTRKREMMLITKPEHAHQILQRCTTRHMTSSLLTIAAERFLGPQSLFALEGFDWKYERLKTKSILIRAISTSGSAMADTVTKMISRIKTDIKYNAQLDMHAIFLRLHFAVIGKTVLGDDFGFFSKTNSGEGEEMILAFEYLVQNMPRIFYAPEIMESAEWKARSEDAHRACRQVVRNKIRAPRARGPSLLNDLFELLAPKTEEEIVKEVTDCIMQFFLAGFNTVAVEMSFCLFYLCQNPVWWNAVRHEVDELFSNHTGAAAGSGGVFDDILHAKLPVLNAIRMETLRLVPPSAFTSRVLDADLPLVDEATGREEVVLKRGTDAFIPIVCLHANPESWGQQSAFEFDPKRWLEPGGAAAAAGIKPGNFLAFSAGPRNCVGESFSKAESLTALAMLVHYFSFHIVPGSRQIPKYTGFGIRPFDSSQGKIAMNLLVSRRLKPRQVEYTMRKIKS